MTQESVAIPLKLDGVVIGFVSIDKNNELVGHYTNSSIETYLKELILTNMLDSVSLIVDYADEKPVLGVPEPGELGYLRLV